MKILAFSLALTMMASTATPTSAQLTRNLPPPPAPPMPGLETELARQQSFRDQPSSHELRRRRESENRSMERAERLAALVNAGKCHEAHRTALAEGDSAMAQRIAAVCSGAD